MSFPVDDVTLAMLEAACTPEPGADGRSHLFEMLDGAEGELIGHQGDVEVRQGGWPVTSCVLALVQEVQRTRSALALIHNWAALGGENGAQPHARIMLQAQRTLDDPDHDPSSMA